jgi:type II secretory pathway pseudopilin PulG
MEQNKSKTTAPDFFIYLGVIIGLYAVAISLISLLFDLINIWLPDVAEYGYLMSSSYTIRSSIAVLVIFFPAFMYLSRISTKAVVQIPEKKEMWVRRWFSYLTLFVSGSTVAVDLSVLVYRFIGGEDLTLRFFLKILVILSIAVAVFAHYLHELRRDYTLPTPNRRYLAYTAWLVIIVSIILGIVVIGTPTTQRNIRFDQQRESDLSTIQNAITDYYRANNSTLPKSLTLLSQGTSYYISDIRDPLTGAEYGYSVESQNQYKLCAIFSLASFAQMKGNYAYPVSEDFTHGIGQTCFDRTAGEIPTKAPVL